MRKIRATAGNVLIKPDKESERVGLIWKPQTAMNRDVPEIGTVVAIGGMRLTKKGVLVAPEFKVGDKVLLKKFTCLFVNVDGQELLQTKQHEILAVLTNE